MPNGLPVHKTPEKKVFGIIGETVSTDEGEVYTKQSSDTRNVGWNEILEYLVSPTPTATPTVTPTGTRPFVVTQTISPPAPTPTLTATPFPTLTRFVAPTFTPTPTSTPTPTLTTTVTPTVTTTKDLPIPTPTKTSSSPIPTSTPSPTATPSAYAVGATINWSVDTLISQTSGDGYLVGDVLKANYTITSDTHVTSFTIKQRSGDPDPYSSPWIDISGPSYTYVAPTAGYYQLQIIVNYDDSRSITIESPIITVVSFDRPSVTASPSTVTRGANTLSTITISEGFAGLGYITSWGITGDYTIESDAQNTFYAVFENNIGGYGTFYLNPFKRLSNGRTIYGSSQTIKIQKQTYRIGYTLDSSGYIRFSYEDADGVSQIVEKFGTPYQTIYPDYGSPCASAVTLLTPGGAGRSVTLTSVAC